MNIITIIKNELRQIIRNRVNLILLIVMPVAMIGLMGNALKPFLNVDQKRIEKFHVIYVNKDSGYMGKSFDTFIRGEGSKYFELVNAESQDIESEMNRKKIDEAIVIPENLTEKVLRGEDIVITSISSGKDTIKDSVVKSMLGSFKDTTNQGIGIARTFNSYSLRSLDSTKIQSDVFNKYGFDYVNSKNINQGGANKLGSFQYFSVTMLIFFLLTSGMGLGVGIVDERSERIYSRISSFPVTSSQYLLGKTLGNAVIGICQAALIILFTSIVFKVNWGSNYIGLLLVILAVLFISSGFAVIFSSLLNSSKALSTALIVVYWIMTFISGAFAPIPAFESIGKFTVNRVAFEAVARFMSGEGIGNIMNYLLILAALCLSIWAAGIMLYRRRMVSNE